MDVVIKLKANLESAYGCILEDNVFVAAISLFPAILVANADGSIDKKEKEYLAVLADSFAFHSEDLTDEEKEKLSDSLFQLLTFLSANDKLWQDSFLKALKHIVNEDSDAKNEIAIIIEHIARVSDSISLDEQSKINWLKNELAI